MPLKTYAIFFLLKFVQLYDLLISNKIKEAELHLCVESYKLNKRQVCSGEVIFHL